MPLKDLIVQNSSYNNNNYDRKHPNVNSGFVNEREVVAIYGLCTKCNTNQFINPITKLCLKCTLELNEEAVCNEENESKISK